MASSTCTKFVKKVSKKNVYLIYHGERIVGKGFRPIWSRQLVKECKDVLAILGKVLGPVVQQGEHVIGSVFWVDAALGKEVAVALLSLNKVLLGSQLDVLLVKGDEVVSVWPGVLVDKSEGVKQLVHRNHQASIETAPACKNI